MHYTLIQEFEGKIVEVTTVKREFTGTLKYELHKGVLIVTPTDKWIARRFGPAFVDITTVVAIREVLPRPANEKDNCEDDCGEDDCCDESPKAKKREDKQPDEPKLKTLSQVESMYKDMIDEERGR